MIDFNETFNLVAKIDSIRLTLAITIARGVKSLPYGREELFSSWEYLKGYLHGVTIGVHSELILIIPTEEVSLCSQ